MLNAGEKRIHDFYSSCVFYLGAIFVTLLAQALAGVISSALGGVVPDIAKNGDFNTAFMIFIQLLMLLYIVLFNKFNNRKLNFTLVNERQKRRLHFTAVIVPVACACVLMCGMFLPTMWYGYFTRDVLGIPPEMGQINLTTPSSVAMIVIASVFLAPACEEAVYRGVLFNGLKGEYGAVKAALLSALAFMLMHMSPVQVVFQFALGVTSAFIMLKSGRLISSVLLHASANALALAIELTALGDALSMCVDWLANNIAAAVFITLGLFVAAFGLMFVLIKFCIMHRAEDPVDKTEEKNSESESISNVRKKDGKIWYIIGVAICGAMLLVNTVVSML